MQTDVVDLRAFYASPLGKLAERSIVMALSSLWKEVPNERLLGLGFANPFLDRFSADTERTLSMMPARQGACSWPHIGPSTATLVYDHELPLPDSSVDRILMVHLLEHSEDPQDALHEAWRILSPGGRLIVVVPNRRGIWARFEHTPFGTGRPYSRTQLINQLNTALFSPDAWGDALHFPPVKRQRLLQFQPGVERLGRRLWPIFSGVTIVEATKRLYQGIPSGERIKRRVFVPVLSPQPSGTAAGSMRPRKQFE